MIITSDTIEVLKNYAGINQSMVFKQGSVLKTVNEQTNVLSKCTISESFPQDFAIYDLNKFLGVLSLFTEPTLDFRDKSVVIKSGRDAQEFIAGDQLAEYQFANIVLFEDQEEILDKTINLPTVDADFELQGKYLNQIMRAAAVMSLPEIAVYANNNKLSLLALETKMSVDSYSVDLGETQSNFKMIFKIENLKLLPGSYNVKISNKGLGHFSNIAKELEYWIATEQSF
jgi:hypothetical protein